jgi:hypothetical protein
MADRQSQRMHHSREPVMGHDLSRSERPGVPMETEPPRPLTPTAHWTEPVRMKPQRGVTKRVELRSLTPVYSTALKLHGMSGLVRRMAYRIPETEARHWMTLLLADRVDVLEHRVGKLVKALVIVPAATAAAVVIVSKLLGRR